MAISLSGSVALVTGGASGIGRGIAAGLARADASVAVADIDAAGAERAAGEIASATGAAVIGVGCDVTDETSVAVAFERVAGEAGEVTVLVNNAGIAPSGPLAEFDLDAWRKTLEVNLTGYFLCGREAARRMTAAGIKGAIINMSSKSGVRGSADNSAYTATKFGEIGLTQGWARELAPLGIRVNAVCPGNVFEGSGIWNDEYKAVVAAKLGIAPDKVVEHYVSKVPLGRECTAEDVANLVVFLASEKASYITGCLHLVDGGQEMR